jgi:nicotinate dehydrogenase subunit B
MREIVGGLRALPDDDIEAMATYFASLTPIKIADEAAQSQARELAAAADSALRPVSGLGATLFDGACAVCHSGTDSHLFGARLSLALNTNVHSAKPDNLVRVILDGWSDAENASRGAMPAFRGSLDDRQIAELVAYIRRTQAPTQQPWSDLQAKVALIRMGSVTASHKTAGNQ